MPGVINKVVSYDDKFGLIRKGMFINYFVLKYANKLDLPPYKSSIATIWSPVFNSWQSCVVAAIPEAAAMPAGKQ